MRKNIFLTGLVILISLSIRAQNSEGGFKRSEISISFDNIFSKSPYYVFSSSLYGSDYSSYIHILESMQNTPKAGLGYKFNFSKGAIRSRISFGSSNSSYENPSTEAKYDNSLFSISGSLGYEFHIDVDKTQFFTGIDINTNYAKAISKTVDKSTSSWYNPVTHQNEMVEYESTDKDTDKNLSYGASPFVGIKYFISPMFSISTEMKFFIETYEETSKSEYTTTNPNYTGTLTTNPERKYTGLNTKLGPMGYISFNIHF